MLPKDLLTLTSLRFFAALMIFVFHLREFAPADWESRIAPGMYHGVSFFFVLSGFVLTHAYCERFVGVAAFYRARVARIVPLHIASLLLLMLALPTPVACGQHIGAGAALAAFALKLTMLDAWVPLRSVQSSWNNVSWSISVEMAFYAAFPWLMVAMAKRPATTLGAAAAVVIAVGLVGQALGLPVFSTVGTQATLIQLGCDFPLARGFEFVLGMATCLVWRRWVALAPLSPSAWTALEAGALVAAILWLGFAVPALVSNTQGLLFVWLRAAGSAPLFAALLLAMAGGRGRLGRALTAGPLVKLGEVSFAFYLVHVVVMRTMVFDLGATEPLGAFALSLGLAFLLHEGVEIPMRRRILSRPLAAAPQPA